MSINLFANTKNTKNTKGWSDGLVDVDHMSGLGSPLMTDALVVSHDGISGAWADVKGTPPQLDAESRDTLRHWSTDVRAAIFAFDLMEPLVFEAGKDAASEQPKASLLVRDADDNRRPLLSITRPPDIAFQAQVPWLGRYADLRPDRAAEILAQATDITSFAGSIGLLHPERTSKTMELLSVLTDVTSIIVMRFKHALPARRPVEYSAQVQPMIQTPAHSTFPQGHATQAFMQAFVLSELLKATDEAVYKGERVWKTMFRRQAIRTSVNRIVAGVHFPINSVPGALLGIELGRYFVAMSGAQKFRKGGAWSFKVCNLNDSAEQNLKYWGQEFKLTSLLDCVWDQSGEPPDYVEKPQSWKKSIKLNPPDTLKWLWAQAAREWPRV